jgi:DNA topoisomerase VI subunit B
LQRLERTTFETSRAAEYFDARQLSALTGVAEADFASVCLKELIDNALDACETARVAPDITVEVGQTSGMIRITISDNGPGIPPEVVPKVLNFNTRTSDKAAYRSPTRGAQGNALKTILGIPYALGSREPVVIAACGVRHTITPWVDPAGEVRISHDEDPEETSGTRVSLAIPEGQGREPNFHPLDWVRSFAAFNPHATFRYLANSGVSEGAEMYKSTCELPFKKYVPSEPPPHTGTALRL